VQLLWLEKKYDVLMIKLFDRIHNMQTIGAKSPEKIKKIVDETLAFFFAPDEIFGINKPYDILYAQYYSNNKGVDFVPNNYSVLIHCFGVQTFHFLKIRHSNKEQYTNRNNN